MTMKSIINGYCMQSEMDPYSLWEDDDTRVFYECLTDLKTKVPAVSSCYYTYLA